MKKVIFSFITIFIVGFGKVSYAQTAYCDTTPPTTGTGTVGTAMIVQACFGPNDVNGNPITLTSFNIYDNNASTPITMTRGATAPVSGLTVYTGAYTPPSAGNHTLQITAIGNSKESAKSASFLLTASLPPAAPTAPSKLSVQ